MKLITIDFETYYSRLFSLSKMTTEEYIRSPEFETIGVAVQVDDGEPVWCSGDFTIIKSFLDTFDWDDAAAIAHNAMFDMAILNWVYDIKPKRIADTLSMARALHGIEVGGSLKALAEYYEAGVKGTEVLDALGKRREDFDPQQLAEYGAYCCNDVAMTYTIFRRMMEGGFPVSELQLIDLTVRMFTEPVLKLDVAKLVAHGHLLQTRKEALLRNANVRVEDLMSNGVLAGILTHLDVRPPTKISPTTGKETYAFAKTDEEFTALLNHPNDMVQSIVAARLGVKSTLDETRAARLLGIGKRGTLPIPLKYYAAHTGRWGGDDAINMQNLPRGSALKNTIRAPAGYVLVDSDSSQIEARTLAWWAGQDDLVEAFAKGEDVYKIMASAIYGVPEADITKDQRFVGKTTILGCGYGMGAVKFQAQLKTFKVAMDGAECERIINVYRSTYPAIPALWRQANEALLAIMSDRTAPLGRDGVVQVEGRKGIRLPNGLYIKYPNLRWEINDETGKKEMVYDTKKGRATMTTRIYGGKCLSANTEALTSRGWVVITSIGPSDKLWDGEEWVEHEGLIFQGEKRTLMLDGVGMTPDHQVLTSEGWQSASSCSGLHRAGFRLPDGSEIRGDERPTFALDVPLHLREVRNTHRGGCSEVREKGRHVVMRVHGGDREQDPWDDKAPGVLGLALNAGPLQVAHPSGVEKLRGQGDHGMHPVGEVVCEVLGGHGADVQTGADLGSHQQLQGLFPNELQVGIGQGTSSEQAGGIACGHTESAPADQSANIDAYLSLAPGPVYDIRNAGPRSRFVVKGTSGPFIVHNCVENVVQALARIAVGEQMLVIAKKYKVVMTVHDAVCALVPEKEKDTGLEFVELCMRLRPSWAPDLPLNCEAGAGLSYGDC